MANLPARHIATGKIRLTASRRPDVPVVSPHVLEQNQVHLWIAPLDLSCDKLKEFELSLSEEELSRASRFRFPELTNRYVAAHGWLRQLLGSYVGQPPCALEFCQGPNGKPALLLGSNPGGIQFNMAHSGALAAIAITRDVAIGVDIELVHPIEEIPELVSQFFSQRESALFQVLPEAKRLEAFFNLWTRKEAWLKATGEGIGHLLNQVEVTFEPGRPARLLNLPLGYTGRGNWTLHHLVPLHSFVAAMAIHSSECDIQTRWVSELPKVSL